MTNEVTCPNCSTENYPTAQFCQRCGLWLTVDFAVGESPPQIQTMQFSHEALSKRIEALDEEVNLNDLPANELALQVLENGRIITITHDKPVILGRFTEKNYVDEYFIDLTEHGGHNLGVSREHAKITYTKGDYWIVDLNSSNGTRVGKVRLDPFEPAKLSNGDVIYFGKFPVILRYKTLKTTP